MLNVHWSWVALAYISYLAAVSLSRSEFRRSRGRLLPAAAAAWAAFAGLGAMGDPGASMPAWLAVAVPALVLAAGYWMSGLLFVRPDVRIERWLRSIDDAVLIRSGVLAWFRAGSSLLTGYFELSYLLVYVLVPAGAATLLLSGHGNEVGRFWTTVLLAEFTCYGLLPWIQTRPPRVLEAAVPAAAMPALRRFNLGLVNVASIGANTVPSGHAAGAVATALAVGTSMPLAGAIFLVLACSVTIATILGRYHYVVDSLLGVLVAVLAWSIV